MWTASLTPEKQHLCHAFTGHSELELQISGVIEDNSKKFFNISQRKRILWPSLEPSQRDGSNEGSQHVVVEKKG